MDHSCIYTYNSFTIDTLGRIGHCCIQDQFESQDWSLVSDLDEWYRNNLWMNQVRNDLDSGIKHPSCRVCWMNEKSNKISKRKPNSLSTPSIEHVDLRLSNKCNLMCKMCHSGSSSMIEEKESKLFNKPIFVRDNYTHLMDLVCNLPNLKSIRIAGGEPLLMNETFHMIDKLIQYQRYDIKLEFLTNCTILPNKFLEKIKDFQNIVFICSIDGIKDTIEYQRYPCKWTKIEKNFIELYNSTHTVALAPTITFLNFHDLPNFIEWCSQFKVFVGYNEVKFPSYLRYNLIPLEHREDVFESLPKIPDTFHTNWTIFKNKSMFEYNPITEAETTKLKQMIQFWDKDKGIKFNDYHASNYFKDLF